MSIGPSMKGAMKDGFSSSLLIKLPIVSAIGLALAMPVAVNAASSGRQLEEVVVTAERQEASVQDTSISITAFTSEMLEDFGIRDQTDLQNFIPATVILPYDAAVRGVGRNFRNLGGDPGISTYMNGVYSEDLYTATIGSFWDMERIEVLRGPQGTLYGRNAVGGAMNFTYNKASQEFDYKFKAMVGNFDAKETYGMINGSLIEDQLSGRFVFSNRERDGFVEDLGGRPDLDSRGEENYSISLTWTPIDNLEMMVRTNQANVYRVMGGGDGGGLVQFRGTSLDGLSNQQVGGTFGFRMVDPLQTNQLASDYLNTAQPVGSFTNPTTGEVVMAQQLRIGIDESDASLAINHGYLSPDSPTKCVLTDSESIDGDDLCTYTNGGNFERFDQHGIQFETNWDVTDSISLKYIYGFNDLSYQRITEDDGNSSLVSDRQFYVNHEAQYESHELQAFVDINDRLSFTAGIFFYDAVIHQRGDFFDANASGQFLTGATDPVGANLNLVPGLGFIVTDPINLFSAKNQFVAANGKVDTDADINLFSNLVLAVLSPDPGGDFLGVKHGIDTQATDLLYATRTRRDATAVYAQGVYEMNNTLTLTFGIRWAEDKVAGEENLYRSTTACGTLGACGLAG